MILKKILKNIFLEFRIFKKGTYHQVGALRLYYLLLDEVQFMPRFEEVLNSLLRIHNIDMYVTGSNSKFYQVILNKKEFMGRMKLESVLYLLRSFYAAFGEIMMTHGMSI